MKLIIGGKAQGKLAFAKTLLPGAEVVDSGSWKETCREADASGERGASDDGKAGSRQVIVNRLHLIIRAELTEGRTPEEILRELLHFADERGACLFICDEIGNGIVPMDVFERTWREQTGRILCGIAARADAVWRVYCGIPQQIK